MTLWHAQGGRPVVAMLGRGRASEAEEGATETSTRSGCMQGKAGEEKGGRPAVPVMVLPGSFFTPVDCLFLTNQQV